MIKNNKCPNFNHGRINAPVHACPMCGKVVNEDISIKNCSEDEHAKSRVERYYGLFARSFTLPENVDEDKIKASFKDGMLSLQIPKAEKAKPKAIEVKVE